MSITVFECLQLSTPFGVGPLPRATPARMHAGGPARGNPAGRGLAKTPEEQEESVSSELDD